MSGEPVTLALLTFNQERFVSQALQSALAQTYQPLEILICDDGSSDGTVAIVQRGIAAYRGPHRIRLHRNPANLGCTGNTLSALALAENDLVVFAAGDDISEPARVDAISAAAAGDPNAHSFWSAARLIEEDGRDSGQIARIDMIDMSAMGLARTGWVGCGATLACRKAVGALFGPVDRRADSEDIVLHFRAALLGSVIGLDAVLVQWRRHGASMESTALLYDEGDAEKIGAAHRRIVQQRLLCFRQRLIDLQAAAVRFPHRAAEFAALAVPTRKIVRDQELMWQMMAANPLVNLGGVIKAFGIGNGPAEVLRRLLRFRWPRLWLWLGRRRRGAAAP